MRTDDSLDPATLDTLVPSTDTDLSATVFVKSLAPVACKDGQDRLVDGLDTLAERDVLDGVDLLVWGNSICTGSPLSEVGSGQRIVDSIEEFYDLAADSQFSISPFFRVSNVTTEYSEGAFRRIVPPCRCIALYERDSLAAVFPCVVDGTAYTPEDLVSYLTRQRTPAGERVLIDESA
ncbi:hypothetical protein NDI56_03590 [Haloarcula sp. S1CR25-12]|uniref:Uncharacterized protein n=1 Tax=Haloarcula saliterrae TaxID=2950534 RepID=A0ABU2F8A5_9EURY|nr:HTH domain-containing protein [Haloarcula sp. S1CR25-12]MDS0258492.1 hypothetical protein [Haloarcula sp. S1CR25-12]